MIPEAINVTARALQWEEPGDDGLGHEDAKFVADGIGGRYSVVPPKPIPAEIIPRAKPASVIKIGGIPHFKALLWWAHDEFTFTEFDSTEDARLAAEADWQTRFRELIASAPPAKANGGSHE